MSEIAFHEKAGRSQVEFVVSSLDKCFSPAELPLLSPPFHPHSSVSDLVSLGASWVFSFQPVLPPDYRPLFHLMTEVGQAIDAVTETRHLGF
jgi:hypothetical protein